MEGARRRSRSVWSQGMETGTLGVGVPTPEERGRDEDDVGEEGEEQEAADKEGG